MMIIGQHNNNFDCYYYFFTSIIQLNKKSMQHQQMKASESERCKNFLVPIHEYFSSCVCVLCCRRQNGHKLVNGITYIVCMCERAALV